MSTKSVSRYKKLSDNAGGKPTRDFWLQHKTFSAFNYAQDFGTTVKESLKITRNSNWATLTKSRIVQYQILSRVFQQSQLALPSVQTVTKEDEVGMGVDWIENFRPVWQQTITSQSTQDLNRQSHGTMSCYLLSFLKTKTFFFFFLCINWMPKNIGLVLLFLTLILFPLVCLLQWIARIENWLKLRQQQDTGYTAAS